MTDSEIIDGSFKVLTDFAAREGLGHPSRILTTENPPFNPHWGIGVEWQAEDRRCAVKFSSEIGTEGYETLERRVRSWCAS